MKIGINLVGVSYNDGKIGRYRNYEDAIGGFMSNVVNPLKEEGHEIFFYLFTYDSSKKEDIVKTKGNYFFSNKILVSNGQIFPSEAHLKINKKLDTFNEVIYDDDVFWKDAEHFYIYDFIRNSIESTNSEPQKCSRELEESERTFI